MNKVTIRRVDEIGRIVIPKDFRQMLQIHENDAIEVTVSGKQIIMEKLQLLENYYQIAEKILQLYESLHLGPMIICDCKYILASSGISFRPKTPISSELSEYMDTYTIYVKHPSRELYLMEDGSYPVGALVPIGSKEEPQGAIVIPHKGKPIESEQLAVARFMAKLITNNILNQL